MTKPKMTGESWQVALVLIKRFGIEDAHLYAFARAHQLPSFSPFATPEARLEWARITARIRWFSDAQNPAATQAMPREPMKPLNVRSIW
jgi:hypothetical protein